MRTISSVLLLLALAPLAPASAQKYRTDPPTRIDWTYDRYNDSKMLGWTIHTNVAMQTHPSLLHRTDSVLQYELRGISKSLPSQAVNALREVAIWVEFNSRNNVPVQYHVSADWLRQNGFDPRKESSIEIQAADFANQSHSPLSLMYFLAAAYYQRELGTHHQAVYEAYNEARRNVVYGTTDKFKFRDMADYFSSVSAAYFAGLNAEPFDRAHLESIDPTGYAMVQTVWQTEAK